jgi:hypothetical protein
VSWSLYMPGVVVTDKLRSYGAGGPRDSAFARPPSVLVPEQPGGELSSSLGEAGHFQLLRGGRIGLPSTPPMPGAATLGRIVPGCATLVLAASGGRWGAIQEPGADSRHSLCVTGRCSR